MKIFGFEIKRQEKEISSVIPKEDIEGTVSTTSAGAYGTYFDLDGTAKNEVELIKRYREMSNHPEIDSAIDDIVNDSIITSRSEDPITIDLSKTNFSENIKNKIDEEFKNIIKMLNFDLNGYEIFRRWYIDGRIYYHKVVDEKKIKEGIKELRYIDPLKIKKVKEEVKDKANNAIATVNKPKKYKEYYIYSERGITTANQGVKLSLDSVTYCTSGLYDANKKLVLSYLHKAYKILNQLRMLEDAVVIYRISRAPERRIFYIDVGNLPKIKADQYLRDIMARYKNKLVYDANTGEIRDDRKFQSMLEDYWIPRKEGGRGTEIDTLPGGENLGEMADVDYFRKNLYKALNVPISRTDPEALYSMGRATEITRDELKFQRFIDRVRTRFSIMFLDILYSQLILKNIIKQDEWDSNSQAIKFAYLSDSYFAELKDNEILQGRFSLLRDAENYVGRFISSDYVKKKILKFNEDELKILDKQIKDDKKSGEFDQEDQGQRF